MDPFRRDKREELVVKKWAHVEAHAKIYHKHTTIGSAAWADKYTQIHSCSSVPTCSYKGQCKTGGQFWIQMEEDSHKLGPRLGLWTTRMWGAPFGAIYIPSICIRDIYSQEET